MKVKIEIAPGETREQAEEKLEKALATKRKARKEYYKTERFPDQAMEDLHERVTKDHEKLVKDIFAEIEALVKANIQG